MSDTHNDHHVKLSDTELVMIEGYRMGEKADPIIKDAIEACAQAVTALSKGNKYNRNGVNAEDYFPLGIVDASRSLLEPFTRIHSGAGMEQMRDLVAYAGIFGGWVKAGMPQSIFKDVVNKFLEDFYVNLREYDNKTGVKIDAQYYRRKK